MPAVTPPSPRQLPYRTSLRYYINELRSQYDGRTITTPDGYSIKFYLGSDAACEHVICGKGKTVINYGRAKRIPFIEYMLMNETIRDVKLNLKTRNICFVSSICSCIIVCSRINDTTFKFISFFHDGNKSKSYIGSFNNPRDYRTYI